MALAATFCAAGASTPLVEGAVFRDAARAAINRVGSDAFWDEQLLTGAEAELRLTRLFEEGAWDRGQELRDVDDAVDHVQTVLFNRLVASQAVPRHCLPPSPCAHAWHALRGRPSQAYRGAATIQRRRRAGRAPRRSLAPIDFGRATP